ncbi:MAG: pyridoxamine 5'-phosphate oxidase family protein [Candidatus Brocadiia bacterium]
MRKALVALLVFFTAIYGCTSSASGPVEPTKPVSVQPALKEFAKNLITPSYYKGELSWENVEFILHSSSNGRILTVDSEYPYSVPVSFGYCKERIYIHSTPSGRKITNIQNNQKVLFTVDRYKEDEGWVSINIFGQANIIHNAEDKAMAMARFRLAYMSAPDEIEQKASDIKVIPPDGAMAKMPEVPMIMVEIVPEKVTSRLLGIPKEWLPKMPYLADENMIPAPVNNPLSEEDAKVFQGILPADTVKWALYSCSAGRINVQGKDYPYSVPVNYAYFNGKLYLHSKNWGEKIEDMKNNPRISFSVDRFTKTKWVSVNIFGEAKLIEDSAQISLLMNKYMAAFNSSDYTKIEEITAQIKDPSSDPKSREMMNRAGPRMVLIEITPHRITSKSNNMPLNQAKLPYVLEGLMFKTAVERQQDVGGIHRAFDDK